MTPLTVALPVYNAMPYLPEAVESILGQTLRDFQFLIVNDGSTDDSADYLNSLRVPRVTVVHHDNRGLGNTLNRTLELCETPFYARMDADDISLPERLERQLRFLESNPTVVLCGGQIHFIAAGKRLPAPAAPLGHEAIYAGLLRGRNALCHPSVMLRTRAARAVEGYRIAGAGQDFDFFLRMGEHGRLANHRRVLHGYRVHLDSSVTSRHRHIRCGIAFAIACANRRALRAPEPDYDTFCTAWQRRGWLPRLGTRIDGWGVALYRGSLIDRANGAPFRAWARLVAAAACRPHRMTRHIRLPAARG